MCLAAGGEYFSTHVLIGNPTRTHHSALTSAMVPRLRSIFSSRSQYYLGMQTLRKLGAFHPK